MSVPPAGAPGGGVQRAIRPSPWFIILGAWRWIVVALACVGFRAVVVRLGAVGSWPDWIALCGGVLLALAWGWNLAWWATARYALGPDELSSRVGVLSRVVMSVRPADVRELRIEQSLLQRLAGVGTLLVRTAGGGVVMPWIASPAAVLGRARALTQGQPPEPGMIIIGLTGGIGSGKSAVARAMAAWGAIVSDSDAESREVINQDEVRRTLVEWWGPEVLGPDGLVDRRRVAQVVFEDPEQRTRLEGLIHPRLKVRRDAMMREARGQGRRVFVIDAPLLLEAGLDRECDIVIFVDAPRETRLARVKANRGWDEAELDRREKAQLPLEEKRRRADEVLVNDAGPEGLAAKVRVLLDRLTSSPGAFRRRP